MNVVLLNGSPHVNGCTFTGLTVIRNQLKENGVDAQLYQVGRKPVIGCTGCGACKKLGKCTYDNDGVNEFARALRQADGMIVGTAVHYASATGAVTSFLDRLFYSMDRRDLRMKFGASFVSCRRGGASAAFDQLNKYFTINQMPVVSSCYWNSIHGNTPEEVMRDEEGMRILNILAINMAYLIKCKLESCIPLPEEPPAAITNFIR